MRFSKNTFSCFSPLVMAITIFIEVGLLIYGLFRYKRSTPISLSLLVLFCLALFQAAEYGICENLLLPDSVWAVIGFVSITMLPVLGIHLISSISKKTHFKLILLAYISAAAWSALFIFGDVLGEVVCEGNYVIFELSNGYGGGYFMYYYFWLLLGAGLAWRSQQQSTDRKTKQALVGLIVGYASFVIPATFIWFTYEGAAQGLPSIMCGFAVLFAIILGTYIMPRIGTKSS
jgi:hypothetical protein